MLDAYARAAVEHGPKLLPHLTAYLDWHEAPLVLPRLADGRRVATW